MQLADVMATDVLSVTPDTTLADAARRMISRETGVAAVLDGDELCGVISERDLLRVLADGTSADTAVRERMTRHVVTAAPSTDLAAAMAMMIDGKFRHLPICDSGRVLGMVSMRDLMAWTSFRLREGGAGSDDVDTAELVASIHQMRTGAA